ncbi:MAG: FKBP-type peptidyl-prolyl cis-trans isomerase [Bacteroidota bacterium]
MRSIVLALMMAIAFTACNNSNEVTTPSGLSFNYINKGEGEAVADGQFLILNMVYTDDKDSAWLNTPESGIPIPVMKQDSIWKIQGGKIEQVFGLLKKEDSVNFTISVVDFFKGIPGGAIPPGVDSTGNFNFVIGVEDVIDQDGIMAWQQAMMSKQSEIQLIKDLEIIDKYLSENNIEAEKTESGLRYVVKEEGTGEKPANGDSVRVDYAGQLLEGPYFDTSNKQLAEEQGMFNPGRTYEPYPLKLGIGSVIKGWDEGLTYLNEGSKATLYIPSSLGYGPRGAGGQIGPNSILVFDVELVEIMK